jgi:hypothetical protein
LDERTKVVRWFKGRLEHPKVLEANKGIVGGRGSLSKIPIYATSLDKTFW